MPMEDLMCHSGYWAAEQARREQDARDRAAREKRAETINTLLQSAQTQAPKPEETPAKEPAPAK
jgi:hypothetical protein